MMELREAGAVVTMVVWGQEGSLLTSVRLHYLVTLIPVHPHGSRAAFGPFRTLRLS